MSSDSSKLPPNDPKVIAKIVDRLKKQGLFDKFRKDCLADIDTKPAYQNLCRRVEAFVNKFLSGKKWTPDLNKNKLREGLRKEITEGKMLSNGVDQIVGQVVNPKIYKVFQPEIDAVVCEYFGITPDEREEKLRLREEQVQGRLNPDNQETSSEQHSLNHAGQVGNLQPQFPGTNAFGTQNMLNLSYNMINTMQNSAANALNMPGIGASMAQSIQNTLGQFSNQLPINMFPNMPPTVPNFSVPPPGYAATTPVAFNPNVPPPNMSQAATAQTYSGMSQSFTNSAGFPQVPGIAGLNYASQGNVVNMAGSDIVGYSVANTPIMSTVSSSDVDASELNQAHAVDDNTEERTSEKKSKERKSERDKKKKEVETLTVEDLLNITIPTSSSHSNKTRDKKSDGYTKERSREQRNSSPVVSHGRRESSGKSERKEDRRSDRSSDRRRDLSEEKRSDSYDERHPDRFEERRCERLAFQDPHQEREREHNRRSEYGSSRESSRSSLRELHPKQTQVPTDLHKPMSESSKHSEEDINQSKVYHFAWDDKASDISDVTISSVHTSDLSSFDEQSDGLEDISSGELNSEPESPIKPPEPPTEPPSSDSSPEKNAEKAKPKPRKLVALQYNYSDSEEEETREERKARIARDKEDRYIRRQLRRAELEAKKIEREEEKKLAMQKKTATKKSDTEGSPPPFEKEEVTAKSKRARPHRTKEALKEQLRTQKREQKVQQMAMDRRMASRRQRKRNSKYMSDDFTSIFTDKKKLLSDEGYIETSKKSDPDYYPGSSMKEGLISPSTPTQDEVVYSVPENEVIISTEVHEVSSCSSSHATRSQTRHVVEDRSVSPFSDGSELSRNESEMFRSRRRGRKRNISGRLSPGAEEKKPTRHVESERAHSQRYDDSDLYKPHTSYRSRRRGASPPHKEASLTPATLSEDFRMHTSRRGIRPASPPPPGPNVRTRPPSPPPIDESKGTHWQRYSSPEGFKPAKLQRFPSSPEVPSAYRSVESPEHTSSKAPSMTGRDSDTPIKPASPEPKSVHSGSQSDEGDGRSRVPLSKVNFGVAALRSRAANSVREFGEVSKWSQRSTFRPGHPSPEATTASRPFRQSGNTSPRVEPSARAGVQRERVPKSSPVSPHVPGVTAVAPKYGPQASRVSSGSDWEARSETKRIRKPSQTVERWSRHSSQDDDEWISAPKRKSIKDDKDDWEPISDDDIEYRSKRTPVKGDKHKVKSRKGEVPETTAKPKSKYERSVPQTSQSQFTNQERDSARASQSDEELEEDGPDPEDLMQLIPYESELEDFDFADSPEAKEQKSNEESFEQKDINQTPPEPPTPEPEERTLRDTEESHAETLDTTPTKEIRDAPKESYESHISGEKNDENTLPSDVPELPKAGKSPTDIQEHLEEAELPRPGVSPTAMFGESASNKSPPPSRKRARPSTPLGDPVSSPESGEVGDDESAHESDDKHYRSTSPERDGRLDINESDRGSENSEGCSSSPPPPRHSRMSGSSSRDSRKQPLIPPGADRETRAAIIARHAAEMPMTRASRKRSEEESAPVAKRLRR